MAYVKVDELGNAKQYTLGMLRKEFPNTSFPREIPSALLADFGVFPLTVEPQPSYNRYTQRIVKNPITQVNGEWTLSWSVEDLTQAEIDARIEREVDQATGVSDAEKALGLAMADIWLKITTGKNPPGVGPVQNQATQQQMQKARTQVRDRIKVYIRSLKGLPT